MILKINTYHIVWLGTFSVHSIPTPVSPVTHSQRASDRIFLYLAHSVCLNVISHSHLESSFKALQTDTSWARKATPLFSFQRAKLGSQAWKCQIPDSEMASRVLRDPSEPGGCKGWNMQSRHTNDKLEGQTNLKWDSFSEPLTERKCGFAWKGVWFTSPFVGKSLSDDRHLSPGS